MNCFVSSIRSRKHFDLNIRKPLTNIYRILCASTVDYMLTFYYISKEFSFGLSTQISIIFFFHAYAALNIATGHIQKWNNFI